MNRHGHDTADFFTGIEVEHTPALGKTTLFVVGYRTAEEIDRAVYDVNFKNHPEPIKHIFFGANDSYRPCGADEYRAWESVIQTFLHRGFWCSLDIPFQYVAEFHEGGLCEHDRFIPIIKVPIPYIHLWNYNTCVKIDDRDFADSNSGVWVHQLHDLRDRSRFTSWDEYSKDSILE